MESALNPREIQTRIRAGASIEQVAQEAGVPADQVEPFAAPVLAERQHQAGMALQSPVRRRGETGSSRTLRAVAEERLLSRGVDPDSVDWDAWRTDDRLWIVVGRYTADGADHAPQWRFDPRARYSTALDDDARWLIGETSPASGRPGRRRPGLDADHEPTVDLNDEMALIRATQDAAEMTIPLPASIRQRAERVVVEHITSVEVDAVEQSPTTPPPTTLRPGATADSARPDVSRQNLGAPDVDRQAPTAQPLTPAPSTEAASEPAIEQPTAAPTDAANPDTAPAGVAATTDDEPTGYVETELEQVDGVYDFVPSHTSNLDTLYDMLSGFQEDSVNIYAGLDQLPPVARPGRDEPWNADAAEGVDEATASGADDDRDHAAEDAEPAQPVEQAQSVTQAQIIAQAPGVTGNSEIAAPDSGDREPAATEAEARQPESAPEPESAADHTAGSNDHEAVAVATGWPATMGTEGEPETTLENPVESDGPVESAAPDEVSASTVGDEQDDEIVDVEQALAPEMDAEPLPDEPVDQEPALAEPVDDEPETEPTALFPREPAPQPTGETGEDEPEPTALISRDEVDAAIATPTIDPAATAETASTNETGAQSSTPNASGEPAASDVPTSGSRPEHPAEPEQDPLVDEPAPRPKPKPRPRKGRASVPSWDEIMFGGPGGTGR